MSWEKVEDGYERRIEIDITSPTKCPCVNYCLNVISILKTHEFILSNITPIDPDDINKDTKVIVKPMINWGENNNTLAEDLKKMRRNLIDKNLSPNQFFLLPPKLYEELQKPIVCEFTRKNYLKFIKKYYKRRIYYKTLIQEFFKRFKK